MGSGVVSGGVGVSTFGRGEGLDVTGVDAGRVLHPEKASGIRARSVERTRVRTGTRNHLLWPQIKPQTRITRHRLWHPSSGRTGAADRAPGGRGGIQPWTHTPPMPFPPPRKARRRPSRSGIGPLQGAGRRDHRPGRSGRERREAGPGVPAEGRGEVLAGAVVRDTGGIARRRCDLDSGAEFGLLSRNLPKFGERRMMARNGSENG